MGKTRFKSLRLFLKLLLFSQIYSHHKFEAEAKENPTILKSFEGIKADGGGETGSNDRIHEKEIENDVFEREKRPARLLPLKMIFEKQKNKTTENDNATHPQFSGPATSCLELLKIGYTRNGFYLVKGNDTSDNGDVEIVDCLFKNPNGVKEIKEQRLGFVPLKIERKLPKRRSLEESGYSGLEFGENLPERSKRPARLLPFHLFYGKEKNLTEEENSSKPFFGPPANCIELQKIGYTLNGYYLVNGSVNSNEIEVILCRFQLPRGNNEDVKEERIGSINLDQSKAIIGKISSNHKTLERKIRPVRLISVNFKTSDNGKEKKTKEKIYNNPSNCSDIGKLGYTLNGFYLVNGSDIARRLGVAYCQFQVYQGADRTTREDTFGFFNLSDVNTKNSGTTSTTPRYELKYESGDQTVPDEDNQNGDGWLDWTQGSDPLEVAMKKIKTELAF